ncbi:MAG TPA: peptidoglycan-associated lipoprotein Pal [Sphingomonadaceae bacterium]|jgi:peptidoglycan-associated lipoprotein|nr:peptidoglycan-associated lipoprotein Pal [Sphingomonadaceae bacterium]
MRHTGLTLSFVAALLATTACSKKPPAELPPPPVQQPSEAPPPAETGNVQQGAVPGSKEDFLQQAGSDRVFFGTDQYDIDDEDRATLDKQAAWLRQYSNVRITVEGHCDERGTREYNLALGERRANAAKNYLVSAGVDPSRITVVSYGKERPAVPGDDESAWAQNRRAVTVLLN